MPLAIRLTMNPVVGPRVVPTREVRKIAQTLGNPNSQNAIAITSAVVQTDGRGLSFASVSINGFPFFAFDTGTLALSLTQIISLADELSPCARQEWLRHEQGHVQDNQQLFNTRLEAALRADAEFREILLNPRPTLGHGVYGNEEFRAIQARILAIVLRVWQALTREAVTRRDTAREYAHVWRDIRTTCQPAATPARVR
jgi:hypothetical protein